METEQKEEPQVLKKSQAPRILPTHSSNMTPPPLHVLVDAIFTTFSLKPTVLSDMMVD